MLGGRIFLLCMVFIALIANANALPIINEVLPNPSLDWNSNGVNETYSDEWIEIYSDTAMALNNWVIGDKVKNYTIPNLSICSGCYIVLYGINTSLQLNNDNEEVFLYDENGTLVEKFSYSTSSKDISSCGCSGVWKSCSIPTPSKENICEDAQINKTKQTVITFPNQVWNNGSQFNVYLNFINFDNGTYNLKIEIKNYSSGSNIGQIFNPSSGLWQSTYNYLEGAVIINDTNASYNAIIKIDKEKSYTGTAVLQIKLENYFTSQEYTLDVINDTSSQETVSSASPTQNYSESYLSITNAPSKSAFGDTVNVDITAYRGDTSKYAVYLYVKQGEDIISDKVSFHLDEKFKNYSFSAPIQIKENCDSSYDYGIYSIVLEGLDKIALKDININSNSECESSDSVKRGKVSYKIDFPDEIEIGKEFIVSVKVYNYQNKRQQFSAWSYVYNGNTCYSCENRTREGNAEQAIIEKYQSDSLFLKNVVYSDEGSYKLKVKTIREGYETTKDFTFDIFVKKPSTETVLENTTNAESILNQEQFQNENQSKITGKVVYQSAKKSPTTTILLFVLLCFLLLLYFVLRKKIPAKTKETKTSKNNEDEEEAIEDNKDIKEEYY